MKKLMALTLAAAVLVPSLAFANGASDAALGLGAFAVLNQVLGGVGVFGAAVAPQPVVVAPPPPVAVAPPPVVYESPAVYQPPVVYEPPAVYQPPAVYAPRPVYAPYPYGRYPRWFYYHYYRHPHPRWCTPHLAWEGRC